MTNSEQAIREFADGIMKSHETWGKPWNAEMREEGIEEIMEITTALISEHYVSKEGYIALENTLAKAEAKNLELLRQRDRCLMTLNNCRETIEMLQREIPGEQIVLRHEMTSRLRDIEAAIKNTER